MSHYLLVLVVSWIRVDGVHRNVNVINAVIHDVTHILPAINAIIHDVTHVI